MAGLLGGVATYTVLFTLLLAVAGHVSRPGVLTGALRAHRVVAVPALVAAAVTMAEGLVGGLGAVAVLRGDTRAAGGFLAAAGVLFTLYGGYTWYVHGTGRAGSCGCSRIETPVTGWVVARAFLLAGLAFGGLALTYPEGVGLRQAGAPLAVVLLAAAAFTALLWHLPAAMHDPAAARRPAGTRAPRGTRTPAGAGPRGAEGSTG